MKPLPVPWTQSREAGCFWLRLRSAGRSVLMLDYDGTLAPFKNDPLQAFPYPGVGDRLAALSRFPGVRLVLVSGRSVASLQQLLSSQLPSSPQGSAAGVEIWGTHGWEHLKADGSYERLPLDPLDRDTLERMRQKIADLGYAQAIEAKPASLAVHWRVFEPAAQDTIRSAVESLYARYAGESTLRLLPFDGGIELRSNRYTKGTAVEQILREEPDGLPAAYLGDDLTDEDAFTAVGGRGLSILVRAEPRESAAQFWIKPPEDLLRFLDEWAEQVAEKGQRQGERRSLSG